MRAALPFAPGLPAVSGTRRSAPDGPGGGTGSGAPGAGGEAEQPAVPARVGAGRNRQDQSCLRTSGRKSSQARERFAARGGFPKGSRSPGSLYRSPWLSPPGSGTCHPFSLGLRHGVGSLGLRFPRNVTWRQAGTSDRVDSSPPCSASCPPGPVRRGVEMGVFCPPRI